MSDLEGGREDSAMLPTPVSFAVIGDVATIPPSTASSAGKHGGRRRR